MLCKVRKETPILQKYGLLFIVHTEIYITGFKVITI